DERAVCPDLALLPLPCGHALDLLHPTPSCARAIAKTLETSKVDRFGQVTDRARDHAYHVPEQGVVGWMMDIGLHHRGVHPQLGAVLQAKVDRRLNDKVVDGSEGIRRQSIEVAVERMVLGHRLTMKIRELAQRHSICNAFTQFTVVPVLDPLENERTQDLFRRQSLATAPWLSKSSHQ